MSGSGHEKGGTVGFLGSNMGKMLGFGDNPDPYRVDVAGQPLSEGMTNMLYSMDKIPERGMPGGQDPAAYAAQIAAQGQPWQGTPWAQMDPAYQNYVKAGLGGMMTRSPRNLQALERSLGSSQPDYGEQLNPYQQATRDNWANAAMLSGQDSGLGPPLVNPWAKTAGPFGTPNYQPMTYAEWQALRLPTEGSGGGGGGGTPQPSDTLQGLMGQSADPYGTYGQLGVANPYLQNIQNRFGYNPAGLAYGVNLQQTPSWYLPPLAHPKVVYPPITGSKTSK